MVPNNNLSVLPFYTSVEQQNARKWWMYGKIYPLFTPAGFLLPFQLMREHRTIDIAGTELPVENEGAGYLASTGEWRENITTGLWIQEIETTAKKVFLSQVPAPYVAGVMAVAYNGSNEVTGVFDPITTGTYTGVWELPIGTQKIRIQVYNAEVTEEQGIIYSSVEIIRPIETLKVYTKNGDYVTDVSDQIPDIISIKPFVQDDYDVVVYLGQLPIFQQMDNGQYYVELGDGVQTWYSEVFTVVNDISGYLKLEWWDIDDFRMDAGTIVYENVGFRNILYLCSDIAKPDYEFSEEIIERDGYTFPVKQVSEKKYRFSFLASEYLLDVLRFVRMADFARITKDGQTWFNLDTFLISPEWEDNGDVAAVNAEFTTATVAKKIGRGYIRGNGDFNKDFNDDFNNK